MFEQAFRNIDDVLRKEAGCTTELPRLKLLALALVCLVLQVPGHATAQVIAKQGVEDPNRIQSSCSPMILEFPAAEFIKPVSGKGWRFKGVERLDCDGVHFQYISLARFGKAENGLAQQIEGTLEVGPSFDREAKIIVEILVDGKSIGRGFKERIEAEGQKTTPFRFSFRLSPEASAVLEKSNNMVVRLTLFVWEG